MNTEDNIGMGRKKASRKSVRILIIAVCVILAIGLVFAGYHFSAYRSYRKNLKSKEQRNRDHFAAFLLKNYGLDEGDYVVEAEEQFNQANDAQFIIRTGEKTVYAQMGRGVDEYDTSYYADDFCREVTDHLTKVLKESGVLDGMEFEVKTIVSYPYYYNSGHLWAFGTQILLPAWITPEEIGKLQSGDTDKNKWQKEQMVSCRIRVSDEAAEKSEVTITNEQFEAWRDELYYINSLTIQIGAKEYSYEYSDIYR